MPTIDDGPQDTSEPTISTQAAATRVGPLEDRPKPQVTIADEAGHKLYDEPINTRGPMEACAKAVADAKTADVAESAEQMDNGIAPPFTLDA